MTALSSFLVALTLNVPFLPQTPALCGGAAVAMVFRYYGDRHADVQQFEPLVDRRAGGIADDVLVEAVRQRRWRAVPLAGFDRPPAGSPGGAAQPLVLLLEDRPGRYHYVVAVGVDGEGGRRSRSDLGTVAASSTSRTSHGAGRRPDSGRCSIQPDSADPQRQPRGRTT